MEITKEQILEMHCPSMNNLYLDGQGRDFKDRILEAMELYAESKLKSMGSSSNVSVSASDFYTDLMKLINAHCKKGLSNPDLVAKMEYATDSCKMS